MYGKWYENDMDALSEEKFKDKLSTIIMSFVALVVIETMFNTWEKERHMKIELTKQEVLKIVNARAFTKALEYKGRFGKAKSRVMNFCMMWGIIGTPVGIVGIIVPHGDDSYLLALSGYILASGLLCVPISLRVWKKYKKAKRMILNELSDAEKKAE